MAFPEVRFRFVSNGSKSFETSGSGDLREVVSAVYSLGVAEAMLDLSTAWDREDASEAPYVWGLISSPSVDRASRAYISVFVNRRWVQNRMVVQAIEQAYHGFLADRRYPLAVVNLTVPYHELDVNIHPAKTEVRFTKSGQVFAAVQGAVRRALTSLSPVPMASQVSARPLSRFAAPATTTPFWPAELTRPASARTPLVEDSDGGTSPLTPKKALPALRPLGQVQSTYIVAEGPDGMYLIDQHAAHERVLFEHVRGEARSRGSASQSLLEPATLELELRHQEMLAAHRESIQMIGFEIESFGPGTYLLRRVPSLLDDGDPTAAFLDVLDLIDEGGGFESWEERAAYSVACHGAIRAGKVLTHDEMVELTRQLEDCTQPHTCPHGRPTMIHLSSAHMEREFGRR